MICVLLTTYSPEGNDGPRANYARQTVRSLVQHLHASQPLRLHVTDDGSSQDDFIGELLAAAQQGWGTKSSSSRNWRQGIGGSINRALTVIPEDIILLLPDDLALVEDLDLGVAEQLLLHGYDYVRLDTPGSEIICTTKWDKGVGWWLDVNLDSPGYVFALLPALIAKSFFTLVGPLPEQVNTTLTELQYGDLLGHSSIRAAFDNSHLRAGPWDHIGAVTVGRRESA